MRRRHFLKLGTLTVAAALAAPASQSIGATLPSQFALTIAPANVEMIDGTHVYMLLYFLDDSLPSPVMRAAEGQEITIVVTNSDTRPHGFAITGIAAATVPSIAPGASATITFTAPAGGSYLYHDPFEAPLYRVLGLHGAFIVVPTDGTTPVGSSTPFSRSKQTVQVQSFFDALGGGHPRFPGEKWNPNDPDREKLWLFSQTDPTLNAAVAAGATVSGSGVQGTFLPRYFTINGRSGFDTAVHGSSSSGSGGDHEAARLIEPTGRQGQPCLIRSMNAGLATHSPHIHGNHVMICADTDATQTSHCETHVYERDAWLLKPLDRIDVVLPFERPPDIPAASWPPVDEPFPLRYVMHCHTEMSQTAGGGNYPQGCVTHWEMTGPL
jgi:Multicopper oxidase